MFRYFDKLAYAIAGILLVLLASLTVVDVVGRNLFRSPLPAATELTELALVGLTFLIYPCLAWRREHIVVDLFDHVTSPFIRRIQVVLSGLLGVTVFGAMAWRLWVIGNRTLGYGDTTPFLNIPKGYAIIFMAILAAVTAVAYLVSMTDAFRADGAKQPEEPTGGL